jgi:hypothetical protein
MPDLWNWVAHYNDETCLHEVDENGQHGFADVDQSRLVAFQLIPNREGLPSPVLKITPDIRPIFFRRRTVTIDPANGGEVGRSCVHCLGWQTTVKGTNVASYTFFFEDGSVLITDDYQAV